MKLGLKRVLSILVILITLFGWYISLFGLGDGFSNAKEQMKYGLDIDGGVYVVLEATPEEEYTDAELKEIMEQTREVINNRVNELGVSEATVTVEGTNRIRVEMPGVEDADEAIEAIGTTAKLYFVLSDGTIVLDGSYVEDAYATTDGGSYKIVLKFTDDGATLFEEGTRLAYNETKEATLFPSNCIGIVLDNSIISYPQVNSVISGGNAEISGSFTQEEATTTAALIRGGSLPVELTEVQSSVESATIGKNALEKSIIAGAIGLGLVFIIMIIFFGLLGLFADIALLLYAALFIWSMIGMNAVLTLPGIAALILSIGMAVDANVIIFDRIKEEIALGKSIRVAVQVGFKNALATVLDAQITTLIAAVVLYEIGTTSVKGFALTLMIGIVISIFTAVVITQLFVSLLANSKAFSKNKFFGIKKDGTPRKIIHKSFSFIKHRKIFYLISVVILIIGLVFGLVRGMNYGIDFTGGTTLQIEMHEEVDIDEVKELLAEYELDPEIIYQGENNTQIQIKTIKALEAEDREEVCQTIIEKYELEDSDILASEQFGPSVGNELKANAVKSIILASIGMLIYIIIRFKSWKFGLAAVIGVVHDAFMVISFYLIFGYTVNNPFIAAILTLVGYSINDTIVIFDRIRENNRLFPKNQLEVNIDTSINQTLNRTTLTSLTTIAVMIPLLIFVSDSIAEFIIPLMVGVIVGCYSSIFICSPLYYDFNKKENKPKYVGKSKKNK